MDVKLLILALISCSGADHLNTELLPPANVVKVHLNTLLLPPDNVANVRINTDLLPPANVANVFHESGITFVSPSVRQLQISSKLSPPPITHAFGFVDTAHDSGHHRQLVKTHSSQPVSHTVESSVSALRSPIGIQSNIHGHVAVNTHEGSLPSTHSVHFNEPSTVSHEPTDAVQVRYIESGNHAVHRVDSRSHHFEYKVPLMRSMSQYQGTTSQHHFEKPIAKHTIYGVPTQDEIDSLPVFQNDKFLSPIVRHTDASTHSNSVPITHTIESIFDTSFQHS